MRYFYLMLATVFGLSFVWSVAAAGDRPVRDPAKSRPEEQRHQPVCAKDRRENGHGKRRGDTCRKASARKSAAAYEWIEADNGFILVKHDMRSVSSFE
ncbi:hypothetical protein G6L16_022280 [Agrobacterium tumefaciens]|uniref:hypothetical protein n=1 Tax=Agrobacterium tumefaciens TaxID=358 RepID=UPI001572C039|nr:hypothetical protein [Agrobacterium tumefaciens]NSZ64446.1 hypothetical protein [Agrobacterium tumefaciens]NTA70816.1 hypothetical protein [Agrobacterium tumefaciens]WIE40925.1 hypothetical protein G6L16_022280 [Agrobacterium tumefaciens]